MINANDTLTLLAIIEQAPPYNTDFSVKDQFAGDDKQKVVLNFISNYVSEEDKAYLKAGKYQVSYLGYDWYLNKQ